MSNKYSYLLKNVAVFGIGNIVSKIGSFLLLALYTAHLSASDFGNAELLVTTVSLLIPIFTLSISDAILRFLINAKNDSAIINNGFLVNGAACILVVLSYPLFRLIGGPLSDYFPLLLLLFVADSLERLLFSIDKGHERVKLCSFNSLVSVCALAICSYFFLVKFPMGINGYLYSLISAHLVCSSYLFIGGGIVDHIKSRKIDWPIMKQMLAYSIPLVPSIIAWWINTASDRYLIVLYLGNDQNGLYSAAAKIPNIVAIITTIFFQAWQISGIKEYKSENYSHFYSVIYNLFSKILIIVSSLLILVTPYLGSFLFKGDFNEAWIYVPYLVIGACFSGFSGILSPAYQAAGKTSTLMISTVIGAALNILINIIFLKSFGLQIATISTAISFLVVWYIRLILVKKYVSLELEPQKMFISMILICLEAIAVIHLRSFGIIPLLAITLCVLTMNIKWLSPYFKKLIVRLY